MIVTTTNQSTVWLQVWWTIFTETASIVLKETDMCLSDHLQLGSARMHLKISKLYGCMELAGSERLFSQKIRFPRGMRGALILVNT
jgi:hypothetical protein